jgi:predicted DNA-binding transcriptional regulator AlpA
MTTASKLLKNAEVAARIGIKPNTLEIWRNKGKGPEFFKLDPDSLRSPVRYRESVVEAWLEARVCTNTSQYQPPRRPVQATV